ncbi:hypothetical protein Abr02nite_24200 [Paractinoplanes brasiliensis]|nr:hypothetical protein Abr02nite_24200 [Actinoplanes brasiliensis]
MEPANDSCPPSSARALRAETEIQRRRTGTPCDEDEDTEDGKVPETFGYIPEVVTGIYSPSVRMVKGVRGQCG